MREKQRFYVSKSVIYGVTVYDRKTQAPAFEYGAECDMDDVRAVMLRDRLNRKVKRGEIND